MKNIVLPHTPTYESKFNLMSDRVNLVAPASPIVECLLYLPDDTVQTGIGKVDRARKFKSEFVTKTQFLLIKIRILTINKHVHC